MTWVLQHLFAFARLDDPARIEDRHAVGDRRQHSEVVRDEDHRQLVLAAQPFEQSQDAGLHRHVERCRRLVGDQELRSARQRNRDRNALSHAARELVGVAAKCGVRVRDAHVFEQLDRARRRSAPVEAEMEPNVLGELLSNREHRMQRRERGP
jgi:hypothetical protein